MRLFRPTAAIVAMTLPLPALAQSVADAFECKLPYRPTMESAAKLKVTKQGDPVNMVIISVTTVTFDPGTLKVFGQAPQRVFLTMSEPTKPEPNKQYTVTFTTEFARTPAIETALLGAVKWSRCGPGYPICYRATDPSTGRLSVRLNSSDKISMHCEFRLTEQDLQ